MLNTLDYSAFTTAVEVSLASPSAVSFGTASSTDGVSNIHKVIGGSAGDILTGDNKNNVLDGGSGADILSGGTGAGHPVGRS